MVTEKGKSEEANDAKSPKEESADNSIDFNNVSSSIRTLFHWKHSKSQIPGPASLSLSPTWSSQGSNEAKDGLKTTKSSEGIDYILITLNNSTLTEQQKSRRSQEDPLPLNNLGNTCYLNSMLQAIFILEYFFTYLTQKYDYVKTAFSSLSDRFKMTNELVSIYKEYSKQKALPQTTNAMDDQILSLKASVGEKCSQFNSSHQQDTVEFLTLVLGTIDEEFERIREIPQEQNPIKRYFEIEFESHLRCLKCGQELQLPKQTTHAMHLSIPQTKTEANTVDGKATDDFKLKDIIVDHFKEEKVEHKCEVSGCDGREKVRTVEMSKFPRILFLQLGRYAEDGNKRLEKISTPETLLLSQTHVGHCYRLVAVICHKGANLNSGHYVAYVHNDVNQTWYFCDDDSITKVSIEIVQACSMKTAYCLFYVHDPNYTQ